MSIADHNFSGIYKITNKINGKVYVGQAQNICNRWYEHRKARSRGTKFYNAVKKYGWSNFEFEVVERIDDLLLLNEREQYWMDFYKCCEEEFGYNLCVVANTTRGYKHSEQAKEKMSAFAKTRTGEKNSFYRQKHSPEKSQEITKFMKAWKKTATNEEISQLHHKQVKGFKVYNEKQKKKVAQISLESGQIIKVWDCVMDAAKTLGLKQSSISAVCLKYPGRKTYAGFSWEYV